MAEAKRKWTSGELIALLRKRYDDTRRYAVLEQVGASTGFSRSATWIDALVVNLWPSDGLHRTAYEVKVSRSDFTREITNPSKNAEFKANCHAFWYIAPGDVIKEQELPEGAGWLMPRGDGLVIVRAASIKTNPSLDAGFLAALVRSTKKEETADDRRAKEEFFRQDPGYVIAKRYQEAAVAFLTKKGLHRYEFDKDAASIAAALEKAALSDDGLALKQRTDDVLANFKGRMLEAFERFAELAHIGLTECDTAGAFLLQNYGGEEQRALARSRAKKRQNDVAEKREESLRDLMADAAAHRYRAHEEYAPAFTDTFVDDAGVEAKSRPDLHVRSPRVEPPVDGLVKAAETVAEAGDFMTAALADEVTATKPLPTPALCGRCGQPFIHCPCPPE